VKINSRVSGRNRRNGGMVTEVERRFRAQRACDWGTGRA
jgi:hypothetical protein